ncbi:MAG: helix-turn-helix transcriptional regulator [Tyzzerella sp.]|nr:helix-turn-helix transcriptional regulator [Tyzzerella sp.]
MKKQTLGMMIVSLRKEKGMTQLELAEKMGVTDKAVSKWERDLSCPDINSLPKLAEIFEISVDELMQVKSSAQEQKEEKGIRSTIELILKVVPVAMGVAVVTLSIMKEIDMYSGFTMLGIGLACIGISMLKKEE